MENIFRLTQQQLKKTLHKYLCSLYGADNVINDNGYLYAKGTHPVLLVAHLDTVHKSPPKNIIYSDDGSQFLSSEGIGGDDRCGVLIILSIIKQLKCSVVFCEDEEIGCVGSTHFCNAKLNLDVNYAVEFDRKGNNDYVFYKDFNKDFENHIKKYGFVRAYGSFTDISVIADAYKIECVNISSGYYNPHTLAEFVDINDMNDIATRAFYMIEEKTNKFEYISEVNKNGR